MQPTSPLRHSLLALSLLLGATFMAHAQQDKTPPAPATKKAVMNEAYYSTDVDEAVTAAKRNPTNTNFVGARWYNRTTAKSFTFAKLANPEMDSTVIEGAMGPTAAGEAAAAEAQQPIRDVALDRSNRSDSIQETQTQATSHPSALAPRKVDNPEGVVYVRSAESTDKYVSIEGVNGKEIRYGHNANTLGASKVTDVHGSHVSKVELYNPPKK